MQLAYGYGHLGFSLNALGMMARNNPAWEGLPSLRRRSGYLLIASPGGAAWFIAMNRFKVAPGSEAALRSLKNKPD
jgi:hypothetical protein